jgi:hypothetical protein
LPITFGNSSVTTTIRGSTIITSGNVGIGTTNPGSYILNVNGTATFKNIDIIIPMEEQPIFRSVLAVKIILEVQ